MKRLALVVPDILNDLAILAATTVKIFVMKQTDVKVC